MNNDVPLPLTELSKRISSKTFLWLQAADEEESHQLQLEADSAPNFLSAATLFHQCDSEDEDEEYCRVEEWCSSSFTPDGIGGYSGNNCSTSIKECTDGVDGGEEAELVKVEDGALRIQYILSDAGGGHGDDLWAASRYISNIFADATKCRDLLSPLLTSETSSADQEDVDENCTDARHPLLGRRVIELGAGAGLPSWTAMQCGAKVVCTDQSIPNRIRCMAECAERNLRTMRQTLKEGNATLGNAEMVRVFPYDWGNPIGDIIGTSRSTNNVNEKSCVGKYEENDNPLFDVVIATDCIYMPHFHCLLLDSIKLLMSREPRSLALLPFALHGNTEDDNVWNILELAKEKGFEADVLESRQLIPQSEGMDSKRALVHMIRLRWS